MAGDTYITVVGNLTADPEVRTTSNGGTVVNLTIASTPRQYDRNASQWEDGETLFLRCSAWDTQYHPTASNIQSSLAKGMREAIDKGEDPRKAGLPHVTRYVEAFKRAYKPLSDANPSPSADSTGNRQEDGKESVSEHSGVES